MGKTGSKHTDKTDEELIEMSLHGKAREEAFNELYARYHKGLMANISRFVKDTTEAEDICMEALAKAFQQISTYKKGNKFSTWLLAIARNTAIDHSNREKTKGRKVEKTVFDPADEEVSKMADDSVSPEEAIINSENHEKFLRCIEGLPELYREVAKMNLVDNLGYNEITEKTGLGLNTVKTRIRRAKELITEKMLSADHE